MGLFGDWRVCGSEGRVCPWPDYPICDDPTSDDAWIGLNRIGVKDRQPSIFQMMLGESPDPELVFYRWDPNKNDLDEDARKDVRDPTLEEVDKLTRKLDEIVGRGVFKGICRSQNRDAEGPQAWFFYKDHTGPEGRVALYNDYDPTKHAMNQKPVSMARAEIFGIVKALELDEFDVACKKGQCTKEKDGRFIAGQYYFTSNPDRLERILARLVDPNLVIEGVSADKRKELIAHLTNVKKKANAALDAAGAAAETAKNQLRNLLLASTVNLVGIAIVFGGLHVWGFRQQRKLFREVIGEHAEIAGSKVTLDDLTKEHVANHLARLNANLATAFPTPYQDRGVLGKLFEIVMGKIAKRNNFALVGETDSGKSFLVEEGLPQAIAVELYLLEHPEKAEEVEALGYPRIPEEQRGEVLEFLKKGEALGEPGVQVYTLDMRALRSHGAVFKDLDNKMIDRLIRPLLEKADRGIKVILFIDESREASEEGSSLGSKTALVSLMARLKKIAEKNPNLSIGHGTTTEEFAEIMRDLAQSTRYQGVHVREATPDDIVRRLHTNQGLRTAHGITSVSDSAMKAIIILARELSPSASLNASSSNLLESVAQYAQYRGIIEITWEVFGDYYRDRHQDSKGALRLAETDLDTHIGEITRLIESRNGTVAQVLVRLQSGDDSDAVLGLLRALRSWRYEPAGGFFEGGASTSAETAGASMNGGLVATLEEAMYHSDMLVPVFRDSNDSEIHAEAERVAAAWGALPARQRSRLVLESRGGMVGGVPAAWLLMTLAEEAACEAPAAAAVAGAEAMVGGAPPEAGADPLEGLRELEQFRGTSEAAIREKLRVLANRWQGLSEAERQGVVRGDGAASVPLDGNVRVPLGWVRGQLESDRSGESLEGADGAEVRRERERDRGDDRAREDRGRNKRGDGAETVGAARGGKVK